MSIIVVQFTATISTATENSAVWREWIVFILHHSVTTARLALVQSRDKRTNISGTVKPS